MTDNVAITPGSGAIVAAKDIGSGLLAQRVILAMGNANADVTPGVQAASGALPMVMAAGLSITGPSAQTTGTNILASDSTTPTDATGYASGTIEITSTGTGGGWIVEQSLGGTVWNPVPIYEASVISGAPIVAATTATSSTRVFGFAVRCNYLRVRISTTITGGSIQARAFLSQSPFAAPIVSAVQATAVNLQVTVTPNPSTTLIGDVGMQYRATSSGGATPFSLLSPATPAATAVKSTAGRLLRLVLQNSAASLRSVKFWNTGVGSILLGTTAALFEIDIPAGAAIETGLEGGIAFGTAITVAVTGAKGLSDNTSITANDVSGVLVYA